MKRTVSSTFSAMSLCVYMTDKELTWTSPLINRGEIARYTRQSSQLLLMA
jgi:hypothetical protein